MLRVEINNWYVQTDDMASHGALSTSYEHQYQFRFSRMLLNTS